MEERRVLPRNAATYSASVRRFLRRSRLFRELSRFCKIKQGIIASGTARIPPLSMEPLHVHTESCTRPPLAIGSYRRHIGGTVGRF